MTCAIVRCHVKKANTEMIAETKEKRAANAAEHWKSVYCIKTGSTEYWRQGRSEIIYNKLVELGKNPSPQDVDKVIGNNSWTTLECDSCGKTVDSAVHLELKVYQDIHLCLPCLIKAQEILVTELLKDDEEEEIDG